MTTADPRRTPKGEATMLVSRIGTHCASRERSCASNRPIGSDRSAARGQAAWLERGTLLRSSLPAARPSASVRRPGCVGTGLFKAFIIHLLQAVVPQSGLAQLFRGDARPFQRYPVQLSLEQIRVTQVSSCEVGIG